MKYTMKLDKNGNAEFSGHIITDNGTIAYGMFVDSNGHNHGFVRVDDNESFVFRGNFRMIAVDILKTVEQIK